MNFRFLLSSTILIFWANICFAQHQHQKQIFDSFTLETDTGNNKGKTVNSWDLDGWIGGNENKLWLKSSGEIQNDDQINQDEFWAMYSKNIASFWDGQIGIKHDEQPDAVNYFTVGFTGLAPYFFETEAHLFISENGNFSARLRQENDLLITQKLITQPYFELNFSSAKIENQQVGKGLTSGEFGLQTRYEFTKKFAPYFDLNYKKKFGGTAVIATKNNQSDSDFIAIFGLRFRF